jgi:hypothetical protein
MLRKATHEIAGPELLLVEAVTAPSVPSRSSGTSWLPAFALDARSLDTGSWQTRAARGLSWNRRGKLPQRRIAH